MSGLGETLAALAVKRSGARGAGGGDCGMTPLTNFGAPAAGLRMLAHVPPALEAGAPLVVVLHGCTQDAGAHARDGGWLALADRFGFAVLAPEQSRGNNPNRCFNWFNSARGGLEAAAIEAAAAQMVKAQRLDRRRVFVTGLSAGGAMAAVMLARYPKTFAAGAVVAGLPYAAAEGVQQALSAMRSPSPLSREALKGLVTRGSAAGQVWPRLSVWHGDADRTVAPANAAALTRQWTALLDLGDAPDRTETTGRLTRSQWLSDTGEVMVEQNIVAGLGHGTPLAAGGADPLGQAAPYMLEAGISSSLEILRFWDLAPEAVVQAARAQAASRPEPGAGPAPEGAGLGDRVMAELTHHVPAKVARVISDALKAAGLMR